MTVPSFADLLSRDDVSRFADDPSAFQRLLKEVFAPAIAPLLIALREDGRLVPVEGSGHRRGNFMRAWNAFVAGPSDRDDDHLRTIARWLGPMLNPALDAGWRVSREGVQRDAAIADAHAEVARMVDSGTMTKSYFASIDYCFESGQSFRVLFRDWRVEMRNEDSNEPMRDLPAPGVRHVEVSFPSGDVLVCDWFRIKQFSDAVSTNEFDFEINSRSGREALTRHHAECHGFLSVYVGSSFPKLMESDGILVVGSIDEDREDRPTLLGSICTDYWWATIIEKQRLEDIVGQACGSAEEGRRIVDAYLGSTTDRITRLKLEPGDYHLYFTGDGHLMDDRFVADGVAYDGAEPKFLLSPRRLEFRPRTSEDAAPARPTP